MEKKMFYKPFLLSIFHWGNQGRHVFEFKCSTTSYLRRRTSQNTPRKGPMNSPPSLSLCIKVVLTLVWCFLCLQFQPASIKCQRTSSSTKAAMWRSPALPTADRNLRSPGGCSTPQVRANQWSMSVRWASEHLWCFSQCQKCIFRRETGHVLNAEPRRVSVCEIRGGKTNVGFFIRMCHCAVMDGYALHVSVRRQSRADGKLLYLYQLLRHASVLRTHFIKSICLLHLEAKPHGRVCLISSVCLH